MSALHNIVIAGAGLVGWLAAAAIARSHAGRGGSVTLVPLPGDNDDSLDPFGPATPALAGGVEGLAALLGVNPAAVMRAGGGGFSLGTAHQGWGGDGTVCFLPLGDTGADLNGVGFQHLVWRARAAGATIRMTDYALATLAAQAERFALPSPDLRSVLSTLAPGAFLGLAGLTALARDRALAAGVRLVPAPLGHVQRRAGGGIAALVLGDDNVVSGDLFIDATGPRALLCASGNDWLDWRGWLPFDHFGVEMVASDGTPPPYALYQADGQGWARRIPLLRGAVVTRIGSGPGQFISGRRQRAWDGNIIALGAAACVLDPVGGASLALLLSDLGLLLSHYPVHAHAGPEAASYNRQSSEKAERARDFAILRHAANHRTGDAVWDAARTQPLPDLLAHKRALYESRGMIVEYDGELYSRADWMNLMDGASIRAKRCDIQAQAFSDGDIRAHLDRLRAVLVRTVGTMSSHAQALAQLVGGAV